MRRISAKSELSNRTLPPDTCNLSPGTAVPIPTLFVEKSYTSPLVSTAKPPANVDVAEALLPTKRVAVKEPVVVSSASLRRKLSGMRLTPMVEVAMTIQYLDH